LHKAWIACSLYAAEVASVGDVAIGLIELGIIEQVEDFAAELYPVAFPDVGILQYSDIGLELARAAADRARRVAMVPSTTPPGSFEQSTWTVSGGVRRIDYSRY